MHKCSLCCGMGMVSRTDGLRVPCPACSVNNSLESNVGSYDNQSSISANLNALEPRKLSRSEIMKKNWLERKKKDEGAK